MILALDLASVTGFAVGVPCGEPVFGSWDLCKGGSFGAKAYSLGMRLRGVIDEHKPEQVIFEQPLVDPRRTTAKTMRLLQGLPMIVEAVCHGRVIPVYEVSQSTWRKHFLGHGGLPRAEAKAYAIQLCRDRGWMVEDDNAADACGIWDWACAKVCPEHGSRAGMLI